MDSAMFSPAKSAPECHLSLLMPLFLVSFLISLHLWLLALCWERREWGDGRKLFAVWQLLQVFLMCSPHLPAPPALGTSGEGCLWDSSWICFWSLKSRPHPLPHQNSASLFQALRFYWSQFLSVSFVFWPLPLFIETFRRFCCAVLRELVDLVFLVFVSNLGKQWVSNKIVFAFSNPLISRPNRKMERSFWCGIKKLHS